MESKDDLTGKLARLPNGQLVTIEEVHSDGYVTGRRIGGEFNGRIAVCQVSKLEIEDASAALIPNSSGSQLTT